MPSSEVVGMVAVVPFGAVLGLVVLPSNLRVLVAEVANIQLGCIVFLSKNHDMRVW